VCVLHSSSQAKWPSNENLKLARFESNRLNQTVECNKISFTNM